MNADGLLKLLHAINHLFKPVLAERPMFLPFEIFRPGVVFRRLSSVQGIFPWCFTHELYAAKPDYIDQLAAFVRGRPEQPLDAFMQQSNAVISHDASAQLSRINAPTLTFGRHDVVTSTRFADAMKNGIKRSELLVFESCSRAPIYESASEFNQKTLSFRSRQTR